jgi:hypothetical protein
LVAAYAEMTVGDPPQLFAVRAIGARRVEHDEVVAEPAFW